MADRIRKALQQGTYVLGMCIMLFFFLRPMTARADYSGDLIGWISSGEAGDFSLDLNTAYNAWAIEPDASKLYLFYCNSNDAIEGDPYLYVTTQAGSNQIVDPLQLYGKTSAEALSYSLIGSSTGLDGTTPMKGFVAAYPLFRDKLYCIAVTRETIEETAGTIHVTTTTAPSVILNANGGSGGSIGYFAYKGTAWIGTAATAPAEYITPPTREGYLFTGYYTATEGGEQCITSNGYLMAGAKDIDLATPNRVKYLYAQWMPDSLILTYNNQGAPNTTQVISAKNAEGIAYNPPLPGTVTIPVRTGYTFEGYYSSPMQQDNTIQYYSAAGSLITTLTDAQKVMAGHMTMYARWSPAKYEIYYSDAAYRENAALPQEHTYGTSTVVPNPPAREGYNFVGWRVNSGMSRIRNLTLGATDYTGRIVLYPFWIKSEIAVGDLTRVFDYYVTDPYKGVTEEEANTYDSVALALQTEVTPVVDTSVSEAILQKTQGSTAQFFNASVIKTFYSVPSEGAAVAESTLTLSEIPVAIPVTIDLSTEMQGQNSYTVCRYHTYLNADGTASSNEVQTLTSDPNAAEYYTVDREANTITLHVRMFSTFAIVASEATLDARPEYDGGNADAGINVQGMISQADLEAKYQLDIEWGAMTFDFTTASEWDPYNHVYGEPSYAWSEASFDGVNNKISVTNHSNADVTASLSFARLESQLQNTEITFHSGKESTSEAENIIFLGKVPEEGATPVPVSTYVWLTGTPTTLPGVNNAETYTKVGTITLTFAGSTVNGLTPKKN